MARRYKLLQTLGCIVLVGSTNGCSQQKTDEIIMPKVEETFLVLEHTKPCVLSVSVLGHEEKPFAGGVSYTLELEALETTPCLEQGDVIKFYTSASIGETSWRDSPKYCEYISRVNNVEKNKVPPGMLYFDVEAARNGAVWASETARNNVLVKAEMERNDKSGNYGKDIVWDKLLNEGNGKKGSD